MSALPWQIHDRGIIILWAVNRQHAGFLHFQAFRAAVANNNPRRFVRGCKPSIGRLANPSVPGLPRPTNYSQGRNLSTCRLAIACSSVPALPWAKRNGPGMITFRGRKLSTCRLSYVYAYVNVNVHVNVFVYDVCMLM